METVLLILKIAGIILAAVLGILIAGLICILFVPVRYHGDFSAADAQEEENKKVSAYLRAFWFLRLVRVYVSCEKAVRVRIKLLFFTVFDTAKEKKEKKERRKKKQPKKADKKPAADRDAGKEPLEDTEKNIGINENTAGTGKEESEGAFSEPKRKKGIKQRILKILQTIRNFCDTLKRTGEKTERIMEIWNGEHMAGGRSLLGRELRYLLRHSKPGKLTGYLRFGFEDPATTGYAMAVYYGLIYPIWCPKLSVEPDFERQMLDCRIRIKGKIRAWHFLKSGCKLFFSKDIRRVIEDIRKL